MDSVEKVEWFDVKENGNVIALCEVKWFDLILLKCRGVDQ